MRFPTGPELHVILGEFDAVSRAFDKKLYAPGRRRTRKDYVFSSTHSLARHNLPNYHLVLHHLFIRRGIRKRIGAHFYFPLLKSEKVLTKLHRMWAIICEELSWPVTPASVVANLDYADDDRWRTDHK